MRTVLLTLSLVLLLGSSHGPAARAASTPSETPMTFVHPPFGHCLGIHRVGSLQLFMYLGTRTRFENPTGIAAVKLRSEDDPSTEQDDDELTVFGLNSGRCEIIYNTSLYKVKVFGACGDRDGEFRNPLGITADEDGNVFVADTGNNRVVRLLYRDDELVFVKSFRITEGGGKALSEPSQIALGASGTLYIADTGNNRIVLMSSVGEYVGEINGSQGPDAGPSLDGPVGLAVVERQADWTNRAQDSIVVADRGGARLLRFDRSGKLLAEFDGAELPGAVSFDYLAIDYYGNVYATDRAGSCIHKFDRGLNHITSFGGRGKGDVELDEPRGITLWRRFGQIFVTERAGAQYFWIGTDVQRFSVEPGVLAGGLGKIRVSYFLTEVARVTLEVLDRDGNVVRTIVNDRRRAMGENVELWDTASERRKNPDSPRGEQLPHDQKSLQPGHYTVRLTATATYSSGVYISDTAESPLNVTR